MGQYENSCPSKDRERNLVFSSSYITTTKRTKDAEDWSNKWLIYGSAPSKRCVDKGMYEHMSNMVDFDGNNRDKKTSNYSVTTMSKRAEDVTHCVDIMCDDSGNAINDSGNAGTDDVTTKNCGSNVKSSSSCGKVNSMNDCGSIKKKSTSERGKVKSTSERGKVKSTSERGKVKSTSERGKVKSTSERGKVKSTSECGSVKSTNECGSKSNVYISGVSAVYDEVTTNDSSKCKVCTSSVSTECKKNDDVWKPKPFYDDDWIPKSKGARELMDTAEYKAVWDSYGDDGERIDSNEVTNAECISKLCDVTSDSGVAGGSVYSGVTGGSVSSGVYKGYQIDKVDKGGTYKNNCMPLGMTKIVDEELYRDMGSKFLDG